MIANQQAGKGLGYGNGDEMMLDRNPHMFDLIWQLFGAPAWCHAHITQDGRSVTPDDVVEGPENYGLVAGNGIKAYYAWENGFDADFESIEGEGKDRTWRIDFHGTEGTISIPGAIGPGPDVYYNPSSQPMLVGDDRWEILPTEPPPSDRKWVNSHHRMARSMMDILEGKEPEYELVQGPQARLYLGDGYGRPRLPHRRHPHLLPAGGHRQPIRHLDRISTTPSYPRKDSFAQPSFRRRPESRGAWRGALPSLGLNNRLK